jgi:hypothetical protein
VIRRITVQSQPRANSLRDLKSKNPSHVWKSDSGGRDMKPEFKPQYNLKKIHQKKKKKKRAVGEAQAVSVRSLAFLGLVEGTKASTKTRPPDL